MNPLRRAAALLATVAHDVVTEYKRLDAPAPAQQPPRTEINNTAASTQAAWQPSVRQRANPFGFGQPGGPE